MAAVRRQGRRWQVVSSIYVDGRRRQVCTSFATEAEAQAAQQAIDADRAAARLASVRERHQAAGITLGPTSSCGSFPVGPLVAHLRRLGRLDEYTADQLAIALGVHPAILWPSWWDDLTEEAA